MTGYTRVYRLSASVTAVVCASAMLLATATIAKASCTIKWTGKAGNIAWSEPTNWSSEAVPGAADHVCIPAGATVEVSQEAGSILTLQSEGTLSLTSGSLRLTSSTEPSNTVDLLQRGGQLGGKGSLLVESSFEWVGGEQLEAATTEVGPEATLLIGPGAVLGKSRNLQIDPGATATMGVDGTLSMGEGATVKNAGSFDADSIDQVDGIYGFGGSGAFRNTSTGTFTISGSGPFVVGVAFDNEGAVLASSGELKLEDGGSESSVASFAGSSPEGVVNFARGTFVFVSGVGLSGSISQTGGVIRGPLVVNGSFEWSGGQQLERYTTEVVAPGALSIRSGTASLEKERTLQIDGGASATIGPGGRLSVAESATVKNAGTFKVVDSEESSSRIYFEGAGGTFDNKGQFTASGKGFCGVGIEFDNEGGVLASSGELKFEDGGSESSSASFTSSGPEGVVNFVRGTFVFVSGVGLSGSISQTGGVIRGPLVVKGTFEWSGGQQLEKYTTEVVAPGALSIRSGTASLEKERTLQVDGGVSATIGVGGRLSVAEGTTVKNQGTFKVVDGEEYYPKIFAEGLGGTFENTGQFTASGKGSCGVGIEFDNEGKVLASSGELKLEDGGDESPAASFAGSVPEGRVNFAGERFVFASGVTLGGGVAQTGGVIRGPLVVSGSFEWSGGEQLESTTEIVSGGALSIETGSPMLRKSRTLQVDAGASATIGSDGRLSVAENATVKNSGTFNADGSEGSVGGILAVGAGGQFKNLGTLVRVGVGSFPIAIALENEGAVRASSGELRLEGGGSESPSASFAGSAPEGLVSFAGGAFVFASGVALGGGVAQTGGVIHGPLVVKGSFAWSGGEQLESTTEVVSGGALSVEAGTPRLKKDRILQIDAGGRVRVAAEGQLYLGEGGRVQSAGTFEAGGDEEDGGGVYPDGSGGVFHNTGVMTRSGNGAFPIDVRLENQGTVEIERGTLNVATFAQSSAGVVSLHLAGSQLGTGFTQLDVGGAGSIEGKLRVTTEDGFHPEPSQRFQIMNANPLSGTFGIVEEVGSIGGGWSYATAYSGTGAELVVAGGPVPTSTTASITGAGQTGGAITVPNGSVVTASANLAGANASTATGSISYRVYSDPACQTEVANAGTVPVSNGTIAVSSPEVFAPGTYYWQASYSGDATNQRSSTECGAEVETVPAPLAAAGAVAVAKTGVLAAKAEQLPAPVSGHSANLFPVSGAVSVQLPGAHSFETLAAAKAVPVGTLVNTTKGNVTLCRAIPHGSTNQCAEFNGGEFRIEEKQGAPAAHVALAGGNFSGCAASRAGAARAAAQKSKEQPVRKLWGSGHGHFTTDGRNSSTTVRGTIWYVEDRCGYTLTKVKRGVVSVYDYRLRRTVSVSAGHTYVARAR